MKILLIKVQNLNIHNEGINHPLGLMYIAAYARKQKPGLKIKIFDLRKLR